MQTTTAAVSALETVEPIADLNTYAELARRTLATKVRKSSLLSTLNAATGLCSETGELTELLELSSHYDATHLAKELGDWIWYWALAVHCYGFQPSAFLRYGSSADDRADSITIYAERVSQQIYAERVSQQMDAQGFNLFADQAYEDERPLNALTKYTGQVNELIKKQYFHFHPCNDEHRAKLFDALHRALRAWTLLAGEHALRPDRILGLNIDKLKKRYPDGFSTERSLHRAPGDI